MLDAASVQQFVSLLITVIFRTPLAKQDAASRASHDVRGKESPVQNQTITRKRRLEIIYDILLVLRSLFDRKC